MNDLAIIKEADFMAADTYALANELYREGRLDEAHEILSKAIAETPAADIDGQLSHRNLLCMVERASKNLYEALRIHIEIYPLAQLSHFHRLRANFHNGLGNTYEAIAKKECLAGYLDKALIEYEATRFHLEQADELEAAGHVENNIAVVLSQLGRAADAHKHLERARELFAGIPAKLAETSETAAQICFQQEGCEFEALGHALTASHGFYENGEIRLMNESLNTLLKAVSDYRARK